MERYKNCSITPTQTRLIPKINVILKKTGMECILPEGEGGKSSTAQELHSAITRARTNSPTTARSSQLRAVAELRAVVVTTGGAEEDP